MNSFFVRFILLFVAVFCVLFLLVWFYLSATSQAQAEGAPTTQLAESVTFDTGRIAIIAQDGSRHEFRVELATTAAQRRRGLMFRERLDAGTGMLFDFGPPRAIAMWMKNTLISLDMLFADAGGHVVHVAAHTEPFSHTLISAPMPVRYVLEVPAGTAQKRGLKTGDRLILDGVR